MATTPVPRQRPPDLLYKILNPTFKALLRSPLHGLMSKRLMLLTFSGRKSGKRYTIPVGYVQNGNTLLVATQSRWSRNLHDNAKASVRLRGRWRDGVTNVVSDEEGMLERYRRMLSEGPQLGEIIGVRLGADGEPNHDDVAQARARGHVVVEIQLK